MSCSKLIVDVIILSYTSPEIHPILCRAIDTLIDSEESIRFNIILVESNKKVKYKYKDEVTVIYPKGKFNYNKSVNCGIELCSKENKWVVVCNNDVEFDNGWFSEILKVKEQTPDLKSFSPYTKTHASHDSFIESEDSFFEGTGISVHICGWCLVFEKDLLTLISDLFDEQFEFWYQDDNYARCLIKHNIRHALVKNSVISHLGSLSYDLLEDREAMTVGQHAGFLEKWK